MNKNKRGYIRLSREFLEDSFEKVNIFEKCLVVRCEYLVMSDQFEYYFYSDLLEEVLEGHKTPEYLCKIHVDATDVDNLTYEYKFVKQE